MIWRTRRQLAATEPRLRSDAEPLAQVVPPPGGGAGPVDRLDLRERTHRWLSQVEELARSGAQVDRAGLLAALATAVVTAVTLLVVKRFGLAETVDPRAVYAAVVGFGLALAVAVLRPGSIRVLRVVLTVTPMVVLFVATSAHGPMAFAVYPAAVALVHLLARPNAALALTGGLLAGMVALVLARSSMGDEALFGRLLFTSVVSLLFWQLASRFWRSWTDRTKELGDEMTVALAQLEALRALSEKQTAIFENAASGIALVKDGVILHANSRLHQMLGVEIGTLHGQPALRFLDAAGAAEGDAPQPAARPDGEAGIERQLHRRDGTAFLARMTGKAVNPADPEAGVVWVIDDITHERVIMEQTERARRMAEDAAMAKSSFLANMSHEIRTPMNAILGMTHLTLQTELNARQRGYLENIRSASRHLLGIVDDILDLSKIEAEKLGIERVEFDLERVVGEACTLLSDKVTAKGLELAVRIAPDVPHTLVGDPLRIGQILLNLGSNAVKFTECGEVVIAIDTVERAETEILLRIAVRDTGIGISEEQRARLFERFQQADTSTTRQYGGTGLGLVISRRLANLMGGELDCDSRPGEGSTFHCTLRLGIGATAPLGRQPSPDFEGQRVLVVDDNETARALMGDMLSRMMFDVETAASGADALRLVEDAARAGRPYRIVYLDWRMEGMDGIELARRIRDVPTARPPHLVMVTAYGRDDVINQATANGIHTCLIKPVTAARLFDATKELLDARRRAARDVARLEATSTEVPLAIHGARILVVEDNELNQQVVRELLGQAGVEVDVAANGLEAVRRIPDGRYELVLMDVQMPVMDGLAATRELRRTPGLERLPIIAMTANAMQDDRARCLDAGMNDYVAKPIEPALLFDVLRRWVRPRAVLPQALRPPGARVLPHEIAGLEITTGLRRVGGKHATYVDLLRSFRASQHDVVARLQQALDADDTETADRLAHTTKGVAGMLGATRVEACAAAVEQAIREGQPRARIDACIAPLAVALEMLVGALDAALPPERAPAAELTVDEHAVRDVCREIASLLAVADIRARTLFDAQAGLLKPALGQDFARLRDALHMFDFDTAQDLLADACAARGYTVSGEDDGGT